jgi:hypothetical protein
VTDKDYVEKGLPEIALPGIVSGSKHLASLAGIWYSI